VIGVLVAASPPVVAVELLTAPLVAVELLIATLVAVDPCEGLIVHAASGMMRKTATINAKPRALVGRSCRLNGHSQDCRCHMHSSFLL
jgi:hypothetical protein